MGFRFNQKLLPMKGHYFLYNAGTAPVVPFMPTLAKQLGFSSVIVGYIYTILPILGMLAKPVFGAIADRFHRQKYLFLFFQVLTAVAFFCIMFIPSINRDSDVTFNCNNGAKDMKFCPTNGEELDECDVASLLGTKDTSILSCDLSCQVDPWMWDTICTKWNVTQYCDSKMQTNNIQFTSLMSMHHIEQIGDCLLFEINEGIFSGGVKSTLYCPTVKENFKTVCTTHCNNSEVNDILSAQTIPDKEIPGLYQFWLFFSFMAISWVGMAVVVSVGDAICFEMLGDKPHLYGNNRLWGSIGWGTFSIISGLLLDSFSYGESTKNYNVVFYLTLGIIAVDMFVSSKLEYKQTKISQNIFKDVGKLFKSFRIVVFFIWCILIGLGTALIWNFLFWHLEDLAKEQKGCNHTEWIKTLQGLAMGIQCFGGELPFFFLSGWILKKIGHVHAMSLILFGFGVRFILYSLLENPWLVLPVELLNGITFGLFYATMASYASIVAPIGTEATLQGLVGAIFEGIGVSSGSAIGGRLFDSIGGSKTFRYFGIAAFGFFVIHVVLQYFMSKFSSSQDRSRAAYSTPIDAIHMLEDDVVTPN